MEFVVALVEQYPWIGTIVIIVGSFRLIMKPIFTLIDKYVEATPSISDNEKWNIFKSSKTIQVLTWFVDYFASVKLQIRDSSSKPK